MVFQQPALKNIPWTDDLVLIRSSIAAGQVTVDPLMEATGRLYGVRLDGLWVHVGRPESIAEAEKAIDRSTL